MYCSAERLNLRVIMHTSRHVLIFGTRKNRKRICTDLNDVKFGNLNSQKNPKTKLFE